MVLSVDLNQMVDSILATIVPAALPRPEDHETLARNRAWLLGMENELVALFYDTLYAYPVTATVFVDGERPDREQTLRGWWQRTVGAPIDMEYFRWMAFVGIVHIKRGVTNPMMLSMLQVVSEHVVVVARIALGEAEAVKLQQAFARISTTVGSIISEAYTIGYLGALEDLAGLDPKLTARMLAMEVKRIEAEGRAQLGR
jgi:hypothetical protein